MNTTVRRVVYGEVQRGSFLILSFEILHFHALFKQNGEFFDVTEYAHLRKK